VCKLRRENLCRLADCTAPAPEALEDKLALGCGHTATAVVDAQLDLATEADGHEYREGRDGDGRRAEAAGKKRAAIAKEKAAAAAAS
jgi:hypothetical protein